MTVPAQPVSLGTPPEFGLLQHYASREELKEAALAKAAEDNTKLRVFISQPGRVDRARIYLGCSHGGTKTGASQCTYRIHATHNGDVWQVTKANFRHSHGSASSPQEPKDAELHIQLGREFASQEDFISVCERRAQVDSVDLRTFVNLGRLARRARFAMSCAHGSRANAPKDERCSYSFVAIEYDGVWRVTQACLEHSHPTSDQAASPLESPPLPTPPPRYSPLGLDNRYPGPSSTKRPRAEGDEPAPMTQWVSPWPAAGPSKGGQPQMIWRAVPSALLTTTTTTKAADPGDCMLPPIISDRRPSSSSSSLDSARRGSLGDEWGASSTEEEYRPPKVMRQRAPSLADLMI